MATTEEAKANGAGEGGPGEGGLADRLRASIELERFYESTAGAKAAIGHYDRARAHLVSMIAEINFSHPSQFDDEDAALFAQAMVHTLEAKRALKSMIDSRLAKIEALRERERERIGGRVGGRAARPEAGAGPDAKTGPASKAGPDAKADPAAATPEAAAPGPAPAAGAVPIDFARVDFDFARPRRPSFSRPGRGPGPAA